MHITCGKSPDDPCTVFPREIAALRSMAAFHAKIDAVAKGSFGCVQYTVNDKHDVVKAYVAVAWAQPYSCAIRYHVAVERTRIDEDKLAKTCEAAGDLDSIVELSGDGALLPSIKVYIEAVDGSTAELFVVVKGDQIAKVVDDFVCL
ncbi:hypothetical protein Poli38472_007072 [Pythium oligandrum]|uniref:Uncharacterized protein n=1 Tax=Pythium oligandrum TaxID=41045 RepID=A0A8K1C9A5_PYTOL|nr:hypothetical protein Poli38472_007072 [Pythium oligandrum]|eukprot:TMW58927.1 hypothetical protein Poli38472_007072 [Pythium oligandrum]